MNAKKEMTEKEQRLDEERKSVRVEREKATNKHETDMKQLQSKEQCKLIVGCFLCFLSGAFVAVLLLNSLSTGIAWENGNDSALPWVVKQADKSQLENTTKFKKTIWKVRISYKAEF